VANGSFFAPEQLVTVSCRKSRPVRGSSVDCRRARRTEVSVKLKLGPCGVSHAVACNQLGEQSRGVGDSELGLRRPRSCERVKWAAFEGLFGLLIFIPFAELAIAAGMGALFGHFGEKRLDKAPGRRCATTCSPAPRRCSW